MRSTAKLVRPLAEVALVVWILAYSWSTSHTNESRYILALGGVAVVGFALAEGIRHWVSHTGKTRRGNYSVPLENVKREPRRESENRAVAVVETCHVNGHETCDVYEDWVEIDGRRWTTGHHLENCRNEIDSVDCDSPPDGGGGGGGTDPGPDKQRCLSRSQRDYQTGIANCRVVYILATIGIVLIGVLCSIFAWAAAPACAGGALAAETAASAAFAACMLNEERKKRDRDEDCLSEPVG